MTTPNETAAHRFRLEWTSNSAVKKVTITEVGTGRRFVGADWASWDIAYRQAIQKALTAPPR